MPIHTNTYVKFFEYIPFKISKFQALSSFLKIVKVTLITETQIENFYHDKLISDNGTDFIYICRKYVPALNADIGIISRLFSLENI